MALICLITQPIVTYHRNYKLYVVSGIWRGDKKPYYSMPKHSWKSTINHRKELEYMNHYYKLILIVLILRILKVLMLNLISQSNIG